jgi:hypothetical protein
MMMNFGGSQGADGAVHGKCVIGSGK